MRLRTPADFAAVIRDRRLRLGWKQGERAGSGLWSWNAGNRARGWRWYCARWMPWAFRLLWSRPLALTSALPGKRRELAALWTLTGYSRICGRKRHEGLAGTGGAGGEPRDGADVAGPQRAVVVHLCGGLADGGGCVSVVVVDAAGTGRAWAREDRSVPLGIAAGQRAGFGQMGA